ncbi:MAG: serine/threonine dehydratase [Ilumatobacteraceae bacterium]
MAARSNRPAGSRLDDPATAAAAIRRAASRIAGYVRWTPCVNVRVPLPMAASPVIVTCKLEVLQVTGSFKARGAINSLLQTEASSVIACSGGNHGLAVAWAAQRLGRHATIVVPTTAAAATLAAMRAAGADVVEHGDVPADAFALAEQLVAERGWPLIHPYDQQPTIDGQATLGIELSSDAPGVTHWLVAVGGGGLAAGIALALHDSDATVVPVEPEGCPTLYDAQHAGGPVATPAGGIARTSLGAPHLGTIAWRILRDAVPPSTLVTDDDIRDAQRWLWREARVVAEAGGATALAALTSGAWTPPPDARVGVVICGGNVDALPE